MKGSGANSVICVLSLLIFAYLAADIAYVSLVKGNPVATSQWIRCFAMLAIGISSFRRSRKVD